MAYPTSPKWSYPLTRRVEFHTEIATGDNGTEQRWAIGTGEESWTLSYPRLTLAQRDVLLAAFDAAKGSFDQTIDFGFDGTTFPNCRFDADQFSATESRGGQWTVQVVIRQDVRIGDVGTLASDFPTLSTGARVQLPYTHEHGFDTVAVRTEGARFSRYKRALPVRTWTVGGGNIDGNEAQAIFDQFRLARGRLKTFGFTDPDSGTRYATCRFDSDAIEWVYLGKTVNQIICRIRQVL